MNPTLIPGFEDIITHIRQQEQRIKKLQEENKKLKCEDDTLEDTLASLNFYEEANKELKEKITCLESDSHNEVSQAEFDDMKDELEEQIKKLKEDLEKAWDQRGDKWRKARNKKLEEENKKLKEENDTLFHKADHWKLKYHTLRDQLNLSSEEDSDEEPEDEEEKCEECGKCLEGEDKCGEGCPAYDKGWKETHSDSDCEVAGWSPTSSKEPVMKD